MNDNAARTRSGPAVAALFHRALAVVFLIAWLSLGAQLDVLIGSRGLLPAAPFLAAAGAEGLGVAQLPTVFWLGAGDAALHAGIWVGAGLAVAAFLGVWPRLCTALGTILYLSYATACRTFLSFQWDNLLLECGLLATFLPTDRPARWVHTLFRILLFKLYWESGIAKWQSHLGDWQSGSAMTFYYETSPLPAWPAWYAHHLPAGWHHFESWATLVVELVVPFLIFGPRPLKLLCFVLLSGFQLVNLATSNYGFFVYLTLALHVFLLADRDVERVVPRRLLGRHRGPPARVVAWWRELRRGGAAAVIAVYCAVSALDAVMSFVPIPPTWQQVVAPVAALYEPWRVINTYHLFGHITQERIEPEIQVEVDGYWHGFDLRHKPGDPQRAPDIVAPHQPRVDFQLWFYGLSFQRNTPPYVRTLLERLCTDPSAVQDLFSAPLPPKPQAVRIGLWRYRFSPPEEAKDWWTRELIATTRTVACETES